MYLRKRLVCLVYVSMGCAVAKAQNGPLTGTVQVRVLRAVDSTAMRPNQPFPGTVVSATDPNVSAGTGVGMMLVDTPGGSGYTVKLMRMLVSGAFTSVSSLSPSLPNGAIVGGSTLSIPANTVLTFTLGPPSPNGKLSPAPITKTSLQPQAPSSKVAAAGNLTSAFAAKANTVLKELANLRTKGIYTPKMNGEIAELDKLSKSDDDGSAYHFISYDLMHYTKTEGKPSETKSRKQCANDLVEQTSKGMWNLDKSEACTEINIVINN